VKRYELVGRHDIRLNLEAARPVAGPGQVLVEVGACTVCNRSDLAYYHYLGLRDHCATGCFGHEIAGVIAEVGPGVERVAPGQRVFIRTPVTSGFADYAVAREIAVGLLPQHVPFPQGAILQLLPLAVHATRGVGLGDRVLIIGQGPVGLMALQVARLRGAVEIVVVDLDSWRLSHSSRLGASATIEVDGSAGALARIEGGFDVAIEAVGTADTANACVDLVRPNGLVVLLGTHHVDPQVSFDLVTWERKGLRVHTSAEPTDAARVTAMAVAQRLVDRDLIRTDDLLTDTVPLSELPAVMQRLSASRTLYPAAEPPVYPGPPPRVLKIAVRP
jgi:L-idonate 5-dehydrogenase